MHTESSRKFTKLAFLATMKNFATNKLLFLHSLLFYFQAFKDFSINKLFPTKSSPIEKFFFVSYPFEYSYAQEHLVENKYNSCKILARSRQKMQILQILAENTFLART